MTEKQELDLFFEKNRLKTFKNWPYKSPSKCTKENLAAAGFYFSGSRSDPDLTQCFVCFKELDGWEESDDPWTEHSRRGECPFILLNKTEAEMTVLELYDLVMKRLICKMTSETKKQVEELQKVADEFEEKLLEL